MEIEDSAGLSSRSLKLSAVGIFIDNYEGTGDKMFHSFDNSHIVGVDLMKETATFAKDYKLNAMSQTLFYAFKYKFYFIRCKCNY